MWKEIAGAVAVGLIALKVYVKRQIRRCNDRRILNGKTVIVTGANTGIGYYTALEMAKRGARVIIACRSLPKAREAQRAMIAASGNSDIVAKELDVSSFESVRKFASEILKEERQLNILINNAGMLAGKKYFESKDGIELCWATNHFGPFLLTMLLLDILKKSAPSRIINVSSTVHGWSGKIPPLPLTRANYKTDVYSHTKRANIMFTRELSNRLADTGVVVCSLHPGSVATNLLQNLPAWLYNVFKVIGYLYFKTPEEGAQTSIYCAVSDDIVSGEYYDNCQLSKPSHKALDAAAAKTLFEDSERITGLRS